MTAFSLKTNPKGFLQQVVGKLYKIKQSVFVHLLKFGIRITAITLKSNLARSVVSSDCALAGWPTSRKRNRKNNFNFPATQQFQILYISYQQARPHHVNFNSVVSVSSSVYKSTAPTKEYFLTSQGQPPTIFFY